MVEHKGCKKEGVIKDNIPKALALAVMSVGILLFGGMDRAIANGCGSANAKCVELGFSGATDRPKVNQKSLRVHKVNDGEFAFGFDKSEFNKAYIIFKCQDEETLPNDCRTPLANGKWVVELQGGGSAGPKKKSVRINNTLPRCDLCREVDGDKEYEKCINNACRYPYMVVDMKGQRPPLDPDVIIESR